MFALTVLLALVGLVALAPTILSLTPLGPQLVASAAQGQIDGSLEAKSVSIGWLSSTTLTDVTVKDPQGNIVATAESVVVGKSILGLLSDRNDLGTITVANPQVVVVTRPDGSNLEDLLAPLLAKPSTGPTPAMIVDVQNGNVKLVDAVSDQSWELTPVAAHVESPRGAETAWKVTAEAKLRDSGVRADIAHVPGDATQTSATIEADRFPLEPLQPVLTRLLGPVRLSGAVTGKVAAELADGGKRQKLTFENVDALQVSFASSQYLGQDTLRFEQAKANGTAQLADGVWQFRDLEVRSDVAALVGSGDVRISDFTSAKAIPQTDCDIRGVVDVARVLQMLPHTLRVRQGVQITSGQATMSISSQAVAAGRRFEATLATENIQATNNGRPVGLNEPVQLTAAAVQTAQGWQIEKLDAQSSFLTAQATGTPQNGKLTLQGDLNKLAAELDQFVDLADVRLAGQLGGAIQWQQEQAGTLAASGQLNLTSFELAAPSVMPWKENDLVVTFQTRGVSLSGDAYGLAGGKLEVRSDNDQLDVVLQKGVSAIGASSPLPLDLRLAGNLATWLPRLQAFVPLAGWQASGPVVITAKGSVSSSRIDLTDATLNVQQLLAVNGGLRIEEPEVRGQLNVSYDVANSAVALTGAALQSSTIAIGSEKLMVQTGKEAKITGDVAARGNLTNIMAWLADPQSLPTSQLAGEAEAEATFTHEAGITKANLKGQVTDLAYSTRTLQQPVNGRVPAREAALAAPWETKWSEPVVNFGGEASYDAAKDVVSLNKMQAVMGTSTVVASGTVSQLASRSQLDLAGEVKYDLATWTPKVQAVLGQSFDMYGASTKTFEVHGPLFDRTASATPGEVPLLPLALTGKAGIGWQGAQWMALEVGPAEVSAELKDSTIFVQPTKIPLSQGSLQLSPAIVLRGQNWLISHEPGRIVDQVVITPQMCSAWIKFVQPLVADATEAQGKFSVDVEKALIPISQPKTFDAKGTFVMHNVSIGPGPLARELIGAVQQIKDFTDGKLGLEGVAGLASGALAPRAATPAPAASGKQWLTFPEQEVPVEVVDGRVYHQGLTLHHKEFTLRTSGSVGIADQSLELVCEIPIRDEWLKDPKFAVLKGKTVKIPITGTITNARLDTKAAWSEMQKQVLSNVGGLLQGQLNKGLGKGSGAVQDELQKGQNKIQDELNKGKMKLEDELRNGLKGLFK